MIKEKAHAKMNLALEVMDVKDGYHMVNNLMIPIDIYDELTFEKASDISVENDPFPNDNIVVKASKLFFEYTKISGGVFIKLKKNIPYQAGLAGGSTDGAATLRGLNKLYDANLSDYELLELASKLGSDVPFFIKEKPALCTGRGEKINIVNSNIKPFKILLIKPEAGLSTKEVYKHYQYSGISKEKELFNLLKALEEDNLELLKNNIFNDLGDVALSLSDEMSNIFVKLSLIGLKVYVSGSGPTMYVLDYEDDNLEIINNMFDASVFIKEVKSI
ncbi:MAG: 4-(cytidine 5'-diphospho)-2-C-methyl-D-erythritol kinase [Acholeplasmatales bacterium]|nr:4-(cytidine 5'-diphospho)-2-C-methyl-D-erythritol kinase [Acholeplasmatales bacterium]